MGYFRFLPLKSEKRLARDVSDTFAVYAPLVHDVTDTGFWAQTIVFSKFLNVDS